MCGIRVFILPNIERYGKPAPPEQEAVNGGNNKKSVINR